MAPTAKDQRSNSSGCRVISLDSWRQGSPGRPSAISPKMLLRQLDFGILTRAQKQATLLKYIMSDDINDADLDEMARAVR